MSRQSGPSLSIAPRFNALRTAGALVSTPLSSGYRMHRPPERIHPLQPIGARRRLPQALQRTPYSTQPRGPGAGGRTSTVPLMVLSAAARVPWPGADGHLWDLMGFDGSQWFLKENSYARVGKSFRHGTAATPRAPLRDRPATFFCFDSVKLAGFPRPMRGSSRVRNATVAEPAQRARLLRSRRRRDRGVARELSSSSRTGSRALPQGVPARHRGRSE